jgi:hypothetical protein
MEQLKQWPPCLKAENYIILIEIDCKNLEEFQTSKVISWRDDKWADIHFLYNLLIEPLEGKLNSTDTPWIRPDFETNYENMKAWLLASLAATIITKSYGDLLSDIKAV